MNWWSGREALNALQGHPWPVVPAKSFQDDQGRIKKQPTRPWKALSASEQPYLEERADLWGFPTGAAGIVVLDADSDQALHGLEPNVLTGRGSGGHVWVEAPAWKVKTCTQVLPDLDVRGTGGFAYFFGESLKGPYTVLHTRICRVADLPEVVAEAAGLLYEPFEPVTQPVGELRTAADVQPVVPQLSALQWLQDRCEAIHNAPDGTWNSTFHRAVFGAAGLVREGLLNGPEALQDLFAACDDPEEARAVFQSSWDEGYDRGWRDFSYGTVVQPVAQASDEPEDPGTSVLSITRPATGCGTGRSIGSGWTRVHDPDLTMGRKDLEGLPPIGWLIPGRIQKGRLAQLSGPSGVGKSVMALGWCLDVTSPNTALSEPSSDYMRQIQADLKVTQPVAAPSERPYVLYLAAEGVDGIMGRIRAWEAQTGRQWDDRRLRFRPDVPELLEPEALETYKHMIQITGPWDMVVIDTLSRAIAGANENSQEIMSAAVRAAEEIQRLFGCTVLFVHHFGWEGNRQRGSNVLYSACDNVVYLVKREGHDGQAWLISEKIKDGEGAGNELYQLQKTSGSVVLNRVEGVDPEADTEIQTLLNALGDERLTGVELDQRTGWGKTKRSKVVKQMLSKDLVKDISEGRATYYERV